MNTLRLFLLATLVFLARGAVSLAADHAAALDAIFAGKAAGEPASLLLVMRDQADLSGAGAIADRAERRRFVYEALRARADARQRPLLARLTRAGVAHRSFYVVNMIEVEADRSLAGELAANAEVAVVAANRAAPLSKPAPPEPATTPFSASAAEPTLAHVRAPEVWAAGYTGEGVVLAVADTGMQWDHPALVNRYRGFDGASASHAYNWHDAVHDGPANRCGLDAVAPCDDLEHGTHVTGTAVGTDGGENQIGMAPGARWIGCRNMNNNVGTPARYAECFEFFLAPTDLSGGNPRPDLGADVINNSWGCPPEEGCTEPNILRAVVENVRAAGLFVAVSAGNSGSACSTVSTVPAFYDASFSVGAITVLDTIASFSSRGPVTADGSGRLKPDLVAPGVAVRSSIPGNGYARFSGTSMASPHVAGAVALIWSAAPWLAGRVEETEEILRSTAVPLTSEQSCGGMSGSAVPNPVFGSGRLDVAAAVAAALATRPPPPPAGPAPRIPSTRGRAASRILAPRN